MAERSEGEMKKWSKIGAEAWADDNFKRRRLENPASVLRQQGIEVPTGVDLRVVENTENVTYLTLPAKPAMDVTELNDRDLAGVVGGFIFCCGFCWCSTCKTEEF